MMLPIKVILEAAHYPFTAHYADEYEERMGKTYGGPGSELCGLTGKCQGEHRDVLLAITCRAIGQIEAAWGQSMGLVFHHMGLEDEKDQVHALHDLLMGCLGHGVSLDDDYSEAMEKAEKILTFRCERPAHPCNLDDSPWHELAYEVLSSREKIPQETE